MPRAGCAKSSAVRFEDEGDEDTGENREADESSAGSDTEVTDDVDDDEEDEGADEGRSRERRGSQRAMRTGNGPVGDKMTFDCSNEFTWVSTDEFDVGRSLKIHKIIVTKHISQIQSSNQHHINYSVNHNKELLQECVPRLSSSEPACPVH